jgi:hypothetical protein
MRPPIGQRSSFETKHPCSRCKAGPWCWSELPGPIPFTAPLADDCPINAAEKELTDAEKRARFRKFKNRKEKRA